MGSKITLVTPSREVCVGHEIENEVIQPLKGGQGLGQRGLGYVAP